MMNRSLLIKRHVLSLEEARSKLLAYAIPSQIEQVELMESVNRHLAVDVVAEHPYPHFARAGVDGYAVRTCDTLQASNDHPLVLHVVDTLLAGNDSLVRLEKGQAIRIMTGAPVPDGADAVIMLEQVEVDSQVFPVQDTHTQGAYAQTDVETDRNHALFVSTYICIKQSVSIWLNVTRVGDEIEQGQLLIEQGTRIQPGQIALLATYGYSVVQVLKQPRVAVFATGSELQDIHEPVQFAHIRNSNSSMIAAQIQLSGGIAHDYGILPDDEEMVRSAIAAVLPDHDFVITTGGVSVGDRDVIARLFQEKHNDHLLFNKVAIRPGSPTSAAMIDSKLVIGLSGNPGACFVGFELLVKPLMNRILGVKWIVPHPIDARLTVPYGKSCPYVRYVRARLTMDQGGVFVTPVGFSKSSMMVSIQEANCLMVVPAGGRGAQQDEMLKTYSLSYDMM